ncbi:MAG: site-specific integrase [Tannerella sp.]|jgi:site-specific recombinase XerD|nr:site-specific integrase [Tannerella sp.]
MKKLKDERLFRLIRSFLTVHLPEQRVCSINTIKSYKEALNLLLNFLQAEKSVSPFDVTFKMLDSSMILEFLSWLEKERHCGIATRNQRLACIRAFFNYAGKMDVSLIEYQNDLRKIPIKKGGNVNAVEFITEDALKVLLGEPDATTPKGMRNLFYMILLYDTGARNRELLDLRLRDIDVARGCIHVTGKGNRKRIIPIMEKTADHCRKYLALFHANEQDGNQYLFYVIRKGQKQQMSDDNVARFIRIYGESAKAKCPEIPADIHPHLFRHTRAMHLYRGGMPLALLSEWLGHAHPDSTLIYANADTEMKRIAIQKATVLSNPIYAHYDMSLAWKNDEELLRELYGLK